MATPPPTGTGDRAAIGVEAEDPLDHGALRLVCGSRQVT
jgi:hypothetical protein